MRTITQLKEDIAIFVKKLGDMRALCVSESRDPSKEERAIANQYLEEIQELEAALDLEERAQATLDRVSKPSGSGDRPDPGGAPDPDAQQQKRDRFASHGEFYQAVMRAAGPERKVDPRLSSRAATGLSESVPSGGGFLLESQMASEIITPVWNTGVILPMINKATLTGNKDGMKFNGYDETSRASGSRWGGIVTYWIEEAGVKTPSKPTFRQIEMKLHKCVGLCYATDEMLEDAGVLAQEINKGFLSEFDFTLTDKIINGPGIGSPLGILNSGCVVSVGKESGQAADTIVYENINKMWSRLMASSRTNAVWVINQDCEPQLNSMSLAVGTGGGPVYMPPDGLNDSPYSKLMGRPVVPIEQCQTVGTTGDIMLCDFTKYRAIDKGGIKQDVSIHVQFLYDESVFRFVYRFDGQPELSSEITPANGTNTLSHFVKLASRD